MTLLPVLVVAVLALTDAGFAGCRDVMGRDARIFKDELYREAIRRGLRVGSAVALLSLLWVVGLIASAPNAVDAWRAQLAAMAPVVAVCGSYTVIALTAIGVWAIGESDVRSLASVVVLGPLTLVRPWVIFGAMAWSVWVASTPRAALGIAVPCLLQLGVGPALARRWRLGRRPADLTHE